MPEFDPSSYEPRESFSVAEGDYPFEVIDANMTFSANENEMINLDLHMEIEGREKPLRVFDRLVFVETAYWRIHQFCASVGILDKWESGKLEPEDCIALSGIAHIASGDENKDGKRYMEIAYYKEAEAYSEQPANNTRPSTNAEAAAQHEDAVEEGVEPGDGVPF